MTTRTPHVENVELDIFLIQVEPGKARALDKAIALHAAVARAREKERPLLVPRYGCLGKYDMLCVAEAGTMTRDWFDGCCLDSEQIRCFVWKDSSTPSALRVIRNAAAKYDFAALSFLKIDPEYLLNSKTPPLVTERRLVGNLQKSLRDHGIPGLVLGGFGWHEIALLLWHNDLEELAKAVLMAPQFARAKSDASTVLSGLKTFTIMAIHYDFWRPRKGRNRKDVSSRTWARLNEKRYKNLDLEVFLTCAASTMAAVENIVQKDWGVPAAVFGAEDIRFSLDMQTGLGMALDRLRAIRNNPNLQRMIYSTSTVIGLRAGLQAPYSDASARGVTALRRAYRNVRPAPPFGEFMASPIRTLLDAGIGFLSPNEVKSSTLSGERLDMLPLRKQLHVLLRATLRNVLTRDAYIDMVFALARYHGDLQADADVQLNETATNNLLNYVSFAYQERSWGNMNTLWNVGSPAPLFYSGGMQRILWAAEAIPTSLLGAPLDWNGFVVFGLTRDYTRSHLGVLNLPQGTVFRPQDWWGLFHEVGHEYVVQVARRSGLAKRLESIAREVYGLPEGDYRGKQEFEENYVNFTWEILADIFDLESGFAGDWPLYVRTVTRYFFRFHVTGDFAERLGENGSLALGSSLRRKIEEFLVRLFATWCYHEEYGSEASLTPSVVQSFLASLGGSLDPIAVEGGHGRSIRDALRPMLKAEYLLQWCERYRLWNLLFQSSGQKVMARVLDGIRSDARKDEFRDLEPLKHGVVCISVKDPARLIRYLLKLRRHAPDGELPAKVRIAAILSLWNWYAQGVPRRVEKLAKRVSKATR